MLNVKAIISILKLSIKEHFILYFFAFLMLMGNLFEKALHLEWLYNNSAWIIPLLTLFFIAILTGEFLESRQREFAEKKFFKKVHWKTHHKQSQYKNYILNLKGRKKTIVYFMYESDRHRGYLNIYDSDVLDLLGHEVIIPPSKRILVDHYSKVIKHNEVQQLFILAPMAVQIIEENLL